MERDHSTLHPLRRVLARSLGHELTPELAARIEAAAGYGGGPIDPVQFPLFQCGRLTFGATSLASDLPRLRALNAQQAKEMPGHVMLDFLDLIWREQRGALIQFIASDGLDIVGQIRVFLTTTPTGIRLANEESVFLSKPYRSGRNLTSFVAYCEDCLRDIGMQQVRIAAPLDRRGLPRLAELIGYRRDKVVLVKNLEKQHVL